MLISLPPPYPLFCPPRPRLACSTPTSCVLRPLAAPRARNEPNTIADLLIFLPPLADSRPPLRFTACILSAAGNPSATESPPRPRRPCRSSRACTSCRCRRDRGRCGRFCYEPRTSPFEPEARCQTTWPPVHSCVSLVGHRPHRNHHEPDQERQPSRPHWSHGNGNREDRLPTTHQPAAHYPPHRRHQERRTGRR